MVGPMGGFGPIRYEALSAYARDLELDPDQRARFFRMVRALDAEFLDREAQRSKTRQTPADGRALN